MNQAKRQEKRPLADLIDIFRLALVALVPIVDRVGISWREGESYDDWDRICTALFQSIVLDVIEATLPGKQQGAGRLVPYDLIRTDYSEVTPLYVASPTFANKDLIFVRLTSAQSFFDKVYVAPVDQNRKVIGEPMSIEAEALRYEVRVNGIVVRDVII